LIIAAVSLGQANFDVQGPVCTGTPPSPCGASGDAEGISWNGNMGQYNGTVLHPCFDTASGAGMPVSGPQYLRVICANTGNGLIPQGGPIPAGYGSQDVYVPIPAGATLVSFSWDFYENDFGGGTFNDACSIDVIGACGGASLAQYVYADGYTAYVGMTSAGCEPGVAVEIAPAGPQVVSNAVLPAGSLYLRLRAANGGDNGYNGTLAVDNVTFGFGAVPCSLNFTSPNGPGSIKVDHTPCPQLAGAVYFMAFTFAPGAYPNGWWFGLDISLVDLINWYNMGYPFTGSLDGTGAASFGPTGPGFLPSGFQFWSVSTQWAPGFANFLLAYPPKTYTIP